MLIRPFLVAGVGVIAMASRQASAQTGASPSAPATPNPFSVTQVKRVPISKAVFGEAGIIVNARDDGFIELAAAGPKKTVFLQLRTMAARAWVDSTSRMMRARPRRSPDPKSYRSDVTEHGSSTTMAMNRTITAGESQYSLAFSDDPASAFTVPIEESEADVFVAIVRKAVAQSAKMLDKPDTTARPDSAPPVKKKKPAAKRPSSPPAKTPDTTSTQPKATQPTPTIFKPAPARTVPPKPTATKPTQPA